MVTNTPVGVLGAVVILPSCLDFAVVHQLLRQTSTCRDHGRNELVTQDCAPRFDGLVHGTGHDRRQGKCTEENQENHKCRLHGIS